MAHRLDRSRSRAVAASPPLPKPPLEPPLLSASVTVRVGRAARPAGRAIFSTAHAGDRFALVSNPKKRGNYAGITRKSQENLKNIRKRYKSQSQPCALVRFLFLWMQAVIVESEKWKFQPRKWCEKCRVGRFLFSFFFYLFVVVVILVDDVVNPPLPYSPCLYIFLYFSVLSMPIFRNSLFFCEWFFFCFDVVSFCLLFLLLLLLCVWKKCEKCVRQLCGGPRPPQRGHCRRLCHCHWLCLSRRQQKKSEK